MIKKASHNILTLARYIQDNPETYERMTVQSYSQIAGLAVVRFLAELEDYLERDDLKIQDTLSKAGLTISKINMIAPPQKLKQTFPSDPTDSAQKPAKLKKKKRRVARTNSHAQNPFNHVAPNSTDKVETRIDQGDMPSKTFSLVKYLADTSKQELERLTIGDAAAKIKVSIVKLLSELEEYLSVENLKATDSFSRQSYRKLLEHAGLIERSLPDNAFENVRKKLPRTSFDADLATKLQSAVLTLSEYPGISVSELARQSGFSEVAAMNEAFMHTFGCSVEAYDPNVAEQDLGLI